MGENLKRYFFINNLSQNAANTIFNIESFLDNTNIFSNIDELFHFITNTYFPDDGIDTSIITTAITSPDCIDFISIEDKIQLELTCLYELRKIIISNENYYLGDIYPNPINSSEANLSFGIGFDGNTAINLFDIKGSKVIEIFNEFTKKGKYNISFSVKELCSGIYFYEMKSGSFRKMKHILRIK